MKKYLTWLDDNLLGLLAGFLLIFIPLYPKWPLLDAIPGYLVRIRLEDLFILATGLIFLVQLLRKKVQFSLNIVTIGVISYLIVGALSVLSAIFVTGTVPAVNIHMAKTALHLFRRVEYFSLFFILFGSIRSLKQVKILVLLIFATLAIVTLYGYGQKYFYFPAWSTMNREFAKGWTLYLTEHARVLSTFGGHYDLAGYLVIVLTLCWSFFFGLKKIWQKIAIGVLLATGFWLLILTASRISFGAYLVGLGVVVFAWSFKRGVKWGVSRLLIATFLSVLIMLSFGDLSDRFLRLIHANERVASIRTLALSPFGVKPEDKAVFLDNNISAVTSKSDTPPTPVRPADVTGDEPPLLIATYSATGVKTLIEKPRVYSACALRLDLSTCIRLESTWPRALEGLRSNYLLGSGYATLTKQTNAQFTEAESTDSDFFRALGETGILGFLTFFGILIAMGIVAWRSLGGIKDPFIFSLIAGFLGFLVGLIVNSSYIDIFEASKVAYVFWGVSGLALGTIYFLRKQIKEDYQPLKLDINFKDAGNFIKKVLTSWKTWLIVLALICFALRTYKMDSPIADWHSWRQADTSAVSRNFLRLHKINLLYPQYDDLSSLQSGKDNPLGYRFVEFPIYNLVAYATNQFLPELTIEEAGRLTTALFSSLSLLFIFLIVRKTVNQRAAFLSAVVFALIPFNIFYGRSILPDPTMVALSLAAVYFALKRNYLLSAIFSALALLVKPYAIFLLAPIAYILFVDFKDAPKKAFLPVVLLSLSLLPLLGWRLWMTQFPEGIPASSWLLNGDGIRFKGAFWFWIFADRIARLILGYWGVVLLVFGLVAKQTGKFRWFPLSLLISSLLYLCVFATGNVRHDYYQILIVPSLAIFVGLGLDFLLFNRSESLNHIISKSLGLICVVFMLAFGWYHIKDFYNINHPEIVEAGQFVRAKTDWRALVIAPYQGDTAFLYQTDRKGWPIVEGSIDDMIKKGADYYVSTQEDDLGKELLENSWPVGVEKPEYVTRKYKLITKTPNFFVIQLVPDDQLPK